MDLLFSNKKAKMKFNKYLFFVIFGMLFLLLSSCSSDDYPTIPINIPEEPIEAGPILFITDYTGYLRLFSMELDGSDVKELITLPENYISYASWAPDGEHIVFRAGYKDPSNSWEAILFIMDKNCQNIKRLNTEYVHTDYYSAGNPPFVWSPDSRRIAYTKPIRPEASGYYDIFMYDLTTNIEKQISSDDSFSDHVRGWTYDGKYLVSSSGQGYHNKFIAYYNTMDSYPEKEYRFKDTTCMVQKTSDQNNKLLTYVAVEKNSCLTIYDPEQNNHELFFEYNPYIRHIDIVNWSMSKNKILMGIHYGQYYENSSFAFYKYAIYDLQRNVIQYIPNPFGDNTQFKIVSWRMD